MRPSRAMRMGATLVAAIWFAGPWGHVNAAIELPASLDPDRAAGLDNLDWVPPVGTVLITSAGGSGRHRSASDQTFAAQGGENDRNFDYYTQDFTVFAMSRGDWRLLRVKGRNPSANGLNMRWSPEADADYGNPTQVTKSVTIGYGGVSGTVSQTWTVYPGTIHPFAAERLYHSSWISNQGGVNPGQTVASIGMNAWKVPAGQPLNEDGGWQIWIR